MAIKLLTEAIGELVMERVAIMEVDGGLTHEEAVKAALDDMERAYGIVARHTAKYHLSRKGEKV